MIHSQRSQGIVFKSTNFGEADKILTVITERFGKIKVMARGIRKIKSHLAGALEPFMLLDLQLREGKTFFIVTGAAIEKEFPKIHSDLIRMSKAFYVGELIDRFLPEKQILEDVFKLFVEILAAIEEGGRGVQTRAFEFKMIVTSGFAPEMYNCVHCKEIIAPGGNFWDAVEGGLICSNCQLSHRHGVNISDDAIKLLRFFEKSDLATINRLKVSREIEDESEKIISSYLENILERELKSKKFIGMIGD